jgi:predicted RNA-binding protein with PUA-like domain
LQKIEKMNFWLAKSEPYVYNFETLIEEKKGRWDGVRNYTARNNLRAMKRDDLILFYHSNEGLAVVGIAKVTAEAYPDPTFVQIEGERKGDWSCVDVAPVRHLVRPVTLAEIKKTPELAEMQLLKLSRLSVSAVTKAEFDLILAMSEAKTTKQ